MPEYATTEVRLLVSPELIEQMGGGWSPPVRMKIERDDREPTGWTMFVNTFGPRDRQLQSILDEALYLPDEDLTELAKILTDLAAMG